MTQTLTGVLARFATEAEVPEEAAAASRPAVIDCLGCILAGAAEESGRIMGAALAAEGAGGQATLLGTAQRAGPRDAALANGLAAHALDYDDISWPLYGHPSVAILPAAFALAEETGADLGALLEAYAVGVEVAAKIGRWANPDLYLHGWHATGVIGALGAAAAAARMLGLDDRAAAHALGIAASGSAGLRRNFGSMTKPLHAGRAAETGVLAARLAAGGYTANDEALEGRFGFFETFGGRALPRPDALAESLGAPWEAVDPGIVLKRYPSCGATHCALDALLALRARHGFGHDAIAEIVCGAERLATRVLQFPRPGTGLEGKFSMHFCLAVAAVDGPPGLRHFTPAWVSDARVRALLPSITLSDREDLGSGVNDAVPACVEVVLRDGTRLCETVTVPAGDPRKPMSDDDRRRKFLECAAAALDPAAADAAWEALAAATPRTPARALAAAMSAAPAAVPAQ
jgi:2-methylcitrate dehydratase PrpD